MALFQAVTLVQQTRTTCDIFGCEYMMAMFFFLTVCNLVANIALQAGLQGVFKKRPNLRYKDLIAHFTTF